MDVSYKPDFHITIEKFLELEDKAVHHYIERHNDILRRINQYDLETIGTFELAKVEYLYTQARHYAYKISAHYRGSQRYFEGMEDIERADLYERIKSGRYVDTEGKRYTTSTDAENIARRAKGEAHQKAGINEKYFKQWEGIALTYQDAIYSIKDMIAAVVRQTQGGI